MIPPEIICAALAAIPLPQPARWRHISSGLWGTVYGLADGTVLKLVK